MMRRWQAVWVAVLAGVVLPAAASGQRNEAEWLEQCERQAERSRRAVHCEVRAATAGIGAAGLSVDAGRNGGIVIRGGAVRSAEVSARVQTYASTDAAARALASRVRVVAADGVVRSEGPERADDENWVVTYYITVPQRTDLSLSTVNGPLSITDVSGRIRAEARNGPVRLERLGGDVQARVQNGPLTVVVDGTGWQGAGLDAETVNGPARLIVPDGYSAELEIGTERGPMNIGFAVPVTLTGRMRSRLTTTLGSGGAPLRVVTTNGPFSLQRP